MTSATPTHLAARPEIVVDLGAITRNVATLKALVAPAAMMAVVKADGYGHGMVPAARAAQAGGADWIGVATLEEALHLRDGGIEGPVLCWLASGSEQYDDVLAADVDVSAYSLADLERIAEAAGRLGRQARVHLKIDTGLNRGGATREDWPALCARARALELSGEVTVVGISSHLVAADDPAHPANAAQTERFHAAVSVARETGLNPPLRHLANSAGAALHPEMRFDLVRCGVAIYGLDPSGAAGLLADLGLTPAMTVQAPLGLTKSVAAGEGVSYSHTWVAPHDTEVGLIPVGYAEGIPRAASSKAAVAINGVRYQQRGRICMDQFMIELGPDSIHQPGETVVIFGSGADHTPTATEWAVWAETINYEIVTRIGGRLQRRYVDSTEELS